MDEEDDDPVKDANKQAEGEGEGEKLTSRSAATYETGRNKSSLKIIRKSLYVGIATRTRNTSKYIYVLILNNF